MDKLTELLTRTRGIITARGLNRLAELPPNTITKHMLWAAGNKNGVQCPDKYRSKISEACRLLIIELHGYIKSVDPDKH